MKPIVPDFWKCRGRFSKSAIKDKTTIDQTPIDSKPTPAEKAEERRDEEIADRPDRPELQFVLAV